MKRKAERMPTSVEMLAYIVDYVEENGWPPSRRGMAGHFNISLERAQTILISCREDDLVEVVEGGLSIFTTCAPKSPSNMEQKGPGNISDKSKTLISSSGIIIINLLLIRA